MKGKRNARKGKAQQFSRRQREVESEDMKKVPNRVQPDDREATDYHSGKPNDWRWYAQNEQLVRDYASYPFGAPLGKLFNEWSTWNQGTAFPGIMSLEFMPSVGYADSETAPINMAMRRLYSFVRHANSGASNYDAPDLMLYMICVDSAIMFHEYLKRAYGVMRDYTEWNRYYPKALIKAMRMDFDSLEENLNDFRGYINQYAVKLSQLWIPNSMSYMARHAWMCQGIYTDGTTEKAQSYMYVPMAFYRFTLDSEGVGSAVISTIKPVNTFKELIDYGNSLLNPMIANEDFGIMSGDILKAFGPSGIYKAQGITEDYQILPVYSAEVLSQIENCTIIGCNSPDFKITQTTAVGTGYLVSRPTGYFSINGQTETSTVSDILQDTLKDALCEKHLLNMHHSDVQATEVMVATRLSNLADPDSMVFTASNKQVIAKFAIKTAGSEVVHSAKMWYYMDQQGVKSLESIAFTTYQPVSIFNDQYQGSQTYDPSTVIGFISTFSNMLECFDWHPIVRPIMVLTNAAVYAGHECELPMCDVDFYTEINRDNLYNMTTAAILSEFSIPSI